MWLLEPGSDWKVGRGKGSVAPSGLSTRDYHSEQLGPSGITWVPQVLHLRNPVLKVTPLADSRTGAGGLRTRA